jgi:ribosome-associated protein
MIAIVPGVDLDETELQFEFVRASGPGGQNVNKVSSAVRLRFDVVSSPSLPDPVRDRLVRLAGKKINAEGILTLQAQIFRTQDANRREAVDRLVELIRKACEVPKSRRPTRPTAGSRLRRLESKKRRGETKARRKGFDSNAGDE